MQMSQTISKSCELVMNSMIWIGFWYGVSVFTYLYNTVPFVDARSEQYATTCALLLLSSFNFQSGFVIEHENSICALPSLYPSLDVIVNLVVWVFDNVGGILSRLAPRWL